jgi:hypothetical protein
MRGKAVFRCNILEKLGIGCTGVPHKGRYTRLDRLVTLMSLPTVSLGTMQPKSHQPCSIAVSSEGALSKSRQADRNS